MEAGTQPCPRYRHVDVHVHACVLLPGVYVVLHRYMYVHIHVHTYIAYGVCIMYDMYTVERAAGGGPFYPRQWRSTHIVWT